jgi:hypothetical protein
LWTVMDNFMCQFYWVICLQIFGRTDFWVFLWECLWRYKNLKQHIQYSIFHFLTWTGLIQLIEDLYRQKSLPSSSNRNFPAFWLEWNIFPLGFESVGL